jgi:hypothetical protein
VTELNMNVVLNLLLVIATSAVLGYLAHRLIDKEGYK